MLLGWKNSGFSTDTSVRIKADDSEGRENIARYINRAPLSVEKVEYLPGKQSVIYRAKKIVKGVNRNFEVFDPLVFLAKLTSHVPNRGEHLISRGVIRVSQRIEGRERDIGTMMTGDFFGEMALLHRQPRTATCRAVSPAALYELRRAEFDEVCSSCPSIYAALKESARQRSEADSRRGHRW